MHDRSLVTFLNGFADTSQPLPRGWEEKTDQFGQVHYTIVQYYKILRLHVSTNYIYC